MEFKEIVMKRYAVKKFNNEKISQDQFEELLDMIRFSPSSFNLQPWKIKVVTDQETKDKLLGHSWNQPQITTCSHLLVFCANTKVKGLINKLIDEMRSEGVPAEKVDAYANILQQWHSGLTEEKALSWAQKQIYIALGNAMNGATSLGFESCPMEGFDPKGYSEILQLPEHLIPTVLCPIGYPADEKRPKLRFSEEDILV